MFACIDLYSPSDARQFPTNIVNYLVTFPFISIKIVAVLAAPFLLAVFLCVGGAWVGEVGLVV